MNEKIMPSFGQSFGVLKHRWLDVTLGPIFLMPDGRRSRCISMNDTD